MDYRILSVTFEVDADDQSVGRFYVPSEVSRALGLSLGDDVSLLVHTPMGTFAGIKALGEDGEVYGTDLGHYVGTGERLTITASQA